MEYPSRSKRDCEIAKLDDGPSVVAGRVIGILDGESFGQLDDRGFVLQDASGRLDVLCDDHVKIGQICEVKVERDGADYVGSDIRLLAECDEFYVGGGSPNYQKMIIDVSLRDKLRARARLYDYIRDFFIYRDFVEVETPSMVRLPGMEPYLDAFKTRFVAEFAKDSQIDEEMYLITSPEYAMKKLLVAGEEKIYQICKAFRNKETFSKTHNPEFSMLEWYRAYASYEELMQDTEDLVTFLWKEFRGEDLKWDRFSVEEVFKRFAGMEMPDNEEEFFKVFLNKIEPNLGMERPCIIFDYPASMAALAKVNSAGKAERFEAYFKGMELCNGFTELNDPVEQKKRLQEEAGVRLSMGKDVYSVDNSFIEALQFGMPPAGGNALGLDRLLMLLLDVDSIDKVLYFPYRDL